MRILLADQNNLDDVRNITQTTIRTVYPKYYPIGAVQFFCVHHCDEHIKHDISEGKVYLLKVEDQFVATVTVSGNSINRLFVLPEHQRKGYGKTLLDFAEGKIADSYDSVVLDASFPAKRIYKKRGYVETEYNIIETDNGDHLCYDVMKKSLG